MRSISLSEELDSFVHWWQPFLGRARGLVLDGTWPSIGVLDYLTFHLRLRPRLEPSDALIIRGAATYLAAHTADAWEAAGVPALADIDERGAFVRVLDEAPAPWRGDVLRVQTALSKLLRSLPSPLPFLGDLARPISLEHNAISPFALGCSAGLSPWIEREQGAPPAPDVDPTGASAARRRVELLAKHLAAECAQSYERAHPEELLGQVAELYLNDLIFPPLYVDEAAPAVRGARSLMRYFKELDVARSAALALCTNLAASADEAISCIGFVCAAALTEGPVDAQLVAVGQSKGRLTGVLRPALLAAREELTGAADWLGGETLSEDSVHRMHVEEKLGFLPWLYMDVMDLVASRSSPGAREAMAALLDYDFEKGKAGYDRAIVEEPGMIALRTQRIFLDLITGSLERAADSLRALAAEPSAELSPRFHELRGFVSLAELDTASAVRHFSAALRVSNVSPTMYANLANNLAWSHMLRAEFPQALIALDDGLREAKFPVTLLLNKAHCLWQLGDAGGKAAVERELFRRAPFDRRVFGLHVFEEAQSSLRSAIGGVAALAA